MTSIYVDDGYVSQGYAQTGITIIWGQRIIFVPKSEMAVVQTTPSEIRQLDINDFRLQLKNLEDTPEGMSFPSTHSHNTSVTLSGIVYARVVELINNFTVTFEDGNYAVNLVGANSNIADKVNLNSVSVRASNSAGLVSGGSDPSAIAAAVWSHGSATALLTKIEFARAILQNKMITDPVTGIMTVYADDGVTPLASAQLFEDAAGTQLYRGRGSERREKVT